MPTPPLSDSVLPSTSRLIHPIAFQLLPNDDDDDDDDDDDNYTHLFS